MAAIRLGLAGVPVVLGELAATKRLGVRKPSGWESKTAVAMPGASATGRLASSLMAIKGSTAAAEEDGVGWVADVLDGKAQTDGGGGLAQLGLAYGLKELIAVAEEDGGRGDGIPEHIAEAAQSGANLKGAGIAVGDGVPVFRIGLVGGRADAGEALGRGWNCAGVERGEGDG